MHQERIRCTVAVIIHDGAQRYLILRRNPERYRGWGFVKGGIEEGENRIEAMIRELNEEIGAEILQEQLTSLDFKSAYYDNPRQRVVVIDWFMLELPQTYKIVLQREEWVEYRWATFEEALYEVEWQTQQRALVTAHNLLQTKRD